MKKRVEINWVIYFLLLCIFSAILALGLEIIKKQDMIIQELKFLNMDISASRELLEEAEERKVVKWK